MFTLDEINKEVQLYNKFTNYIPIPNINEVSYIDNMTSYGKVSYSDLQQEKYILYLSPKINEFSIKRQKSIVWHELTHIYDYTVYKEKYDIKALMKSYSEAHATSIEMHYLTNTSIIQRVNNVKTIIDWNGERKSIIDINSDLITDFLKNIIIFSETGHPEIFNYATNQFLYFCGSLSLQSKAKNIFKTTMSNYPLNLFKSEFTILGNAILNKDIQLSISTYIEVYKKATEISINKVKNN